LTLQTASPEHLTFSDPTTLTLSTSPTKSHKRELRPSYWYVLYLKQYFRNGRKPAKNKTVPPFKNENTINCKQELQSS